MMKSSTGAVRSQLVDTGSFVQVGLNLSEIAATPEKILKPGL